MLERRRASEQREVVLAGEDLPPVRDVRKRREGITSDRRELFGPRNKGCVDRDEHEHAPERGHQATGAPSPERAEGNRPLIPGLGQQQRRDQEPREHEERVDPEIAASEMPAMEQQHARNCQTTQTIQGRLMLQPRPRPAVHPIPHGERG